MFAAGITFSEKRIQFAADPGFLIVQPAIMIGIIERQQGFHAVGQAGSRKTGILAEPFYRDWRPGEAQQRLGGNRRIGNSDPARDQPAQLILAGTGIIRPVIAGDFGIIHFAIAIEIALGEQLTDEDFPCFRGKCRG